MAFSGNICKKLYQREINQRDVIKFQRSAQVTPALIQRIGLEAELKGHSGCVNCLEWNETGSLLASGSDDVQIILWDSFQHRALTTIRTGHTGNIFSVKFLPNSNDSLLVSGAADCQIRVHDVNMAGGGAQGEGGSSQVFACHVGRVKRLATAPGLPAMFWSAAEDGTIMQFDLRCPETAQSGSPSNVLINLNAQMGSVAAEAKCLAINPLRPEMLAVGANDPYVRVYDRRMLTTRAINFTSHDHLGHRSVYQWEHPTMDPEVMSQEKYSLPVGCANYFIAGHLPQKQQDYRKRYRALASTYLTFSPDGSELLVNIGGEQIYLFDVNATNRPPKFSLPIVAHSNGVVKDCNSHSKKLHQCNGTTNGVSKLASPASQVTPEKTRHRKKLKHRLPPTVDAIKQKANAVFEKKQFNRAILLYNQAISMVPDSPILYGNRAAAYMKRNWDGDYYAALKDCHSALRLDADHLKANFRMAKCLFELSWTTEASECLKVFMTKFPDYASSSSCQQLEKDIRMTIYSSNTEGVQPPSPQQQASPPKASIPEQEAALRKAAVDYKQRFCGHCNTTTDIKEANFFGSNGQYIVAGSDDGSFFVWEKATTNIVRVLRGDDSIVNCLQPHPSSCLLATSGIDPLVRLWSPRPENGQKDEREVDDSDDAAAANQKRMNADPLEVMLMNMGYRITGVMDGDDSEHRGTDDGPVHCRPS